ncbi:hypothetical protein [Rhizobium johnstonii]|uniref:hypothetical protein n=1 Tax=Rhizobium johnstonii TaxID=3019933 RepID=UPI003F9ADC8C
MTLAVLDRQKWREWARDWLGRGKVEKSEAKLDDPIGLLSKALAGLVALFALPGSEVVKSIVPDLNGNALRILQLAIALATLWAINHVVTAKGSSTKRTGLSSETVLTYSYTQTERIIARLIIVVAIFLFALNYIPSPIPEKDCDLLATVKWEQSNPRKPLTLLLAGNSQTSYSLVSSSEIAITIPAASIPSYSFTVVWENGTRSEFDKFSGCVAPIEKSSKDGQAKILISSR